MKTFIPLMMALICLMAQICQGAGEASSSIKLPSKDTHRTARMTLGRQIGTAECAHIGKNCAMQRDQVENPTSFTYVPCCQHLTCQGIGPSERRNGLGQAHSSDDNYFTGICTLSLDNGGGDLEAYKQYVAAL